MKIFVTISFLLAGSVLAQPAPQTPVASSGKRPFTFEDMMALKRVGGPQPSPDGKWVVFDAVDVDLEKNMKISRLWIVPATTGEARRLNLTTNHEERPRFSPDGKRLVWTSKATDPPQIWMSNFTSESGGLDGTPHQVTSISTGADGGIWTPDGKNIVFLSSVYPDAKDDAENKRRDEELSKSKVKAKIFTKLLYRHWNAYTAFKRSHLFVVSSDAVGDAVSVPVPRDLTPGDHDVPPFNLGGQDMYAISPDSQELAYTSNIDEVEATSTNNEIFIVPMAGGSAKKISTSPGNDNTPLYSPDGKYIAWQSMARAGFEADKSRLFVQDRQSGKISDLTEKYPWSLGARLRGEDVSVHRQEPRGGDGRELWRLHGELVSHDGTFNTESAYGTTEELWFIEWEFKGPPWQQRELYRKFSPHLFADKFKTPTLVVHGQLDYRLDVSEGFQLFTTLQRLKVPSKMLYFPDEGHWVLKPQNSRLWYKTVNDWVDQWTTAK